MSTSLFDEVATGNVVLFLGAGAIYGSTIGKLHAPALLGESLQEKLHDRFFKNEPRTKISLKRICSNIQSLHGENALREALVDLLIPVNPSKALMHIPKLSWNSIYTVNVDDSLERSFDSVEECTQALVPIVLPEDKAARDRTTEVNYYKLHGCLRKPESNLIFSHRDYTDSREKNLRMFASLTSDLCDSPLVFLGFSLEDDDFQIVWESVLKYSGASVRAQSTYLVSPNCPKSQKEAFEIEGIKVIDMGVEEFFPWLSANIPRKPPSVTERVRDRVAPLQQQIDSDFGKKIAPTLLDELGKNFDFVRRLPSTLRSQDKSRFLVGAQPIWDDIQQGLPITRVLEEDIFDELTRWREKPRFEAALITGGTGYGKSTLLMQVAYKVAQWNEKIEILYLRSYGELNPTLLAQYAHELGLPIVVFVDDTYRHIYTLNRLKIEAESNKLPIFLLGATRPADWNNARKSGVFNIQNRFEMSRMTLEEARNLAATMKRSGKLSQSMQRLSLDDLARHYFDECDKHILAGLITSVTEGSGQFNKAIADEYFRIPSDKARSLYLSVAMVHTLGLPVPASLACHTISESITNYHKTFAPSLETTVVESIHAVSQDLLFHTQHRIIAETLIEEVMKPADAVGRILLLAENINPHQRAQYEILLRLYDENYLSKLLEHSGTVRSCFEQLEVAFPADAYIKQHFAIFESHQKNYSRAQDLIEEAISIRGRHSHFLNTQANILLREAINEEDKSKADYLFSAGTKLLRERIEKDADKEIHVLSLVERQLEWARRRDLNATQRLAALEDAQADLDLVRSRIPTSSDIALVAAKLNVELNRIPDAKNLLIKSVKLDGSNSHARVLLARMQLADGEEQDAHRNAMEGLGYAPKNYGLLRIQLDCILKLKFEWPQYRKALIDYLNVAENDLFERINLIKGYIEAADYASAQKQLEKLKRTDVAYGLRTTTKVPILEGTLPLIKEGEYHASGIGKGFVTIYGFPNQMQAFINFRSMPTHTGLRNGMKLKVELALNGLGLFATRIV